MNRITFNDYMKSTSAVFKGCKVPSREPDFVSNSGSEYWNQENTRGKYVIRRSNHWVFLKEIGSNEILKDCNRIASCKWHIKTNNPQWGCSLAAKCYLDAFKKNK